MANIITINTIVNGEHLSYVRVHLASDGASGDISGQVLLDASALAGSKKITTIYRIQGSLSGFSATLNFEDSIDLPFLTLPTDSEFDFDFRECPINNNSGSGSSGDITIDTNAFNIVGDAGYLIFTVGKH